MDIGTIALEVFGVVSLSAAFVKYTLAKRKTMHADDHMRNNKLAFA